MKKKRKFIIIFVGLVTVFFIYKQIQSFVLLSDFKKKNKLLKAELIQIKIENEQIKSQYKNLTKSIKRGGLSIPALKLYNKAILSSVIGRSALNSQEEFLINVGSKDGIYVNAPVIFGQYLVGLVREVRNSTSLVKTIFSQEVNIGCDLEKYIAVGVLKGKMKNSKQFCLLNYLPKEYKYKKGELVYSSSVSIFTSHRFILGKIDSVRKNKLFKQASVLIPLDFKNLTHFVVLLKNK